MMAQLTCQKLCVGYDGKPVLQDLDFEIFAGDYLCIVGENGSGKSTLLRCINLLERPSAGQVIIDGADMTALSAGQLRQKLGSRRPVGVSRITLYRMLEKYQL